MTETSNYNILSRALSYMLATNGNMTEIDKAAHTLNMKREDLARLFYEWAGVKPDEFLVYLSRGYAKTILDKRQTNLLGYKGESTASNEIRRVVQIELMSEEELGDGGDKLHINYGYISTKFGEALCASTEKGLCYLAFFEKESEAMRDLKKAFPNANYIPFPDEIQKSVLGIFDNLEANDGEVKLHVKATNFQFEVWKQIIKVPFGQLNSYMQIAQAIGKSGSSRAVGNAVGANPIAYIIPCHRVVQTNGLYGHYRWGSIRKKLLIGWEAAQAMASDENNMRYVKHK